MSDSQIETVKQQSDIVEVIGERVTLKRAGRNFKGLCPFHGEKSPSFFVSAEMQLYKCFGCGAGGDVLAFLQAFEGMTFPEALEFLAKKAGITLVKVYRNESDSRRERLLEIMHLTGELYHYLLTKHKVGEAARAYLKKRGIAQITIKDFKLGYAPNAWQTLENYLIKKKGYKQAELVAAGLLVKNQAGRTYDRFRGRVMFPQLSIGGKTVGMAGRLLNKEAEEAKYINSPETEIYHKGELLFGLAQARSAVRKSNRIILVEGEFDVLSSVQAHVTETAAIKGSALTREHALLIKRLTDKVVLALDADAAGQEAIIRGITVAEPMGINIKVVEVVGGKDPDEVARENPKEWREMVEGAVSVYQYYMDSALKRFDISSGTGQKEIVKMVLPIFKKIENRVEQMFYLKKLAEKLNVTTRVLEEEMIKIAEGKDSQIGEPYKENSSKMNRRENLERYVLGVGLHLLDEATEYWTNLQENWFEEVYLKRLLDEVVKLIKANKKLDFRILRKGLPDKLQPVVQELYTLDMDWFEMEPETLLKTANRATTDLHELALRQKLKTLAHTMALEKDLTIMATTQKEYQETRRLLEKLDSS